MKRSQETESYLLKPCGGRSSIFLSFTALVLFLSLWPSIAMGKECRNEMSKLGGGTAILRGDVIDTPTKLQAVFNTAETKYQKQREALVEILALANLPVSLDQLKKVVDGLEQGDLLPYEKNTHIKWMAYRRADNRKVRLQTDACWINEEPFDAWTFSLPGVDPSRRFIIPEDCLNLAELDIPSCTATASASATCADGKIRVKVEGQASEGRTITELKLEVTDPDGSAPDLEPHNGASHEWSIDTNEPGKYHFSATAIDDKGMKSVSCTTEATCQPPPPPCEKPSCDLDVTTEWPEGSDTGWIKISTANSTGKVGEPKVQVRSDDGWQSMDGVEQQADGSWAAQAGEGTYRVSLKVDSATEETALNCEPAECHVEVTLVEPPPICPTAEKAWRLRSSPAYGTALGSKQRGTLSTPDGQPGQFQFGFAQGFGFGVEAERLFGKDDCGQLGNWGLNLGLTSLALDASWVLDTDDRWIREKDRVSTLLLTAGPKYHWKHEKWDLHLGPVIGFALFSDADFDDGSSSSRGTFNADFDDSFVFGADLGIDAFLGESWGLTGGVQYLEFSSDAGRLDADVDPLILKLGVLYRF